MEDLTNILRPDDELNEEQLKKYVSGETSPEEMHNVEKQMANSDFVNDAVDGLRAFSSNQKLDDYVSQLNKDLHQHLTSKKEKRKIENLSWIIVAVIVILLLCILAYIVIRMQREKKIDKNSISVQYLPKDNTNNTTLFIL